jgi:SAM-dependent methyltransferase
MQLKTGSTGSLASAGKKLLKLVHRPVKLSRCLSPIDFVRWREFDFALKAVGRFVSPPKYVLDISSPKLLPLTLAARVPGCHVVSTDILQREVDWTRSAAARLGLMNLTTRVEDAREMRFPDNRFDLITSISVIEHIAPEHGGEVPAMRQIARVLAPGGVAIITVPFSRTYFADYVTTDAYERGSVGEPIFFQRFYDVELLQRNLIEASGLELSFLGFIEERFFSKNPRRRVAHYVNGSPRQTFWFGPAYPLLSKIFLSAPKPLDACVKPYLACLVLRKPMPSSATPN